MADYALPFIIQTDASNRGCGAVLMQVQEGDEERVIAFYSAKFTDAERKYFTTEKECAAVLKSIAHFRPYIDGVHFTVQSDHASLQWLRNMKDPSGRLARWAKTTISPLYIARDET